jgi:hypothetical protein
VDQAGSGTVSVDEVAEQPALREDAFGPGQGQPADVPPRYVMKLMSVTCDVSRLNGWSNDVARSNMPCMFLTDEVFHSSG